jgi:hypothetical protein
MIIGTIIAFGVAILQIFILPLSLLNIILGPEIQTAVAWAFSKVAVLQGAIPIFPDPELSGLVKTIGLLTIVGWAIQIIYGLFLFKLVWWGLSKIPFLHISRN